MPTALRPSPVEGPAQRGTICPSACSWPRSRTGNRQAVADIGEEILDVAIFLRLRFQRNRASLAVAGDEAAAGRAHAAPFGAVDRHRIHDSERRRQDLGADALARALYMAARAGKIHLAAPCVEIALAILERFE